MSKDKAAGRREPVQKDGVFFCLPLILMLAALIVYPMLYGLYISFFNTNLVTKWKFVGLKYYLAAFQEPSFYHSLLITVIFMLCVVAGHFVIGFVLAQLLNRDFRGRTLFRVIFTLPWFFPEVVVGLLFTWIMNPMYGILNSILRNLGLISSNVSWLGDKSMALPSVIFVCIWKGYPLVMTMILAGLQSISRDYYEAAQIDGAGTWQQFLHITLPGLKPVLTTVLTLDLVWWFKQYTLVFTMTAGGPGTATDLISLSIYNTAFTDLRFGKASAWGILVFLCCYLISLLSKAVMKDEE